jgi:hypothetical protein
MNNKDKYALANLCQIPAESLVLILGGRSSSKDDRMIRDIMKV